MKIISVTIQNLNSIRGKHILDFEKSFAKHGLFLLTGDTGSGKTTILDAISVALYGETPRLKSKSELEQLIAIGTKESLAEVEFVVDKVLYKSSWKINIARTGTINKAKRELSKYDGSDFEIITSATRGFNNKIEEITNLNFDRFSKTVMLAQGSFDAFLQAKDSEKSDLLEKITGTQIYQKISQRVYEKHKQESHKLTLLSAKIDESKILVDEVVKEKKSEIQHLKKESDSVLQELKALQNSIKTVENRAKYQKTLETLREKKSDLTLQKIAFKEDDKRLERTLKAKEIYTQILQEKALVKDLQEKKMSIDELTEEKSQLANELDVLREKQTQSDTNLALFKVLEKSKFEAIEHAQELLINHSNKENIVKASYIELKEKEKAFALSLKNQDEATQKKKGLQESVVALDKSLSSLVALDTRDNDTLFKEKNSIENKIKSIKTFMQLEADKVKQMHIIEVLELSVASQNNKLLETNKEKEEVLDEIETLEGLTLAALSIKNYEEHRKSLKADERCPLCGSYEHPFLIDMPKFDDSISSDLAVAKAHLKTLESKIKKDEKAIQKNRVALEVAKSGINTLQESLEKLDIDVSEKKDVLEEELKAIALEIQNNNLVQEYKEKSVKLAHDRELLENNLANAVKESDALKVAIERIKESIQKLEQETLEISTSVEELLEDKTVDVAKKELEAESSKLNKEKESLKLSLDTLHNKLTINQTTMQNHIISREDFNQKLLSIQKRIEKLLEEKNFRNREEVLSAYIKDEVRVKELQSQKKSLEEKTIEIETLLKSTQESLAFELKKELTSIKSLEELSQDEKELTLQRDMINTEATVIEEVLKQSDEIKNEQVKILQEIEVQKNSLLPWEILNKLIGSASGAVYQKFVQNLTLGHLLTLANKHLSYLSDRYTLVKTDNEKLDLSIVDAYYIDVKRGVNTLSGGERFLVSLSLALGLSDLVNDKIKVDSLFLDEGFGTLDEASLNMAIVALEKLHAKGKLIGIISHVSLLKDRIYAQIQLKKKSGGSSDIVVIS